MNSILYGEVDNFFGSPFSLPRAGAFFVYIDCLSS